MAQGYEERKEEGKDEMKNEVFFEILRQLDFSFSEGVK